MADVPPTTIEALLAVSKMMDEANVPTHDRVVAVDEITLKEFTKEVTAKQEREKNGAKT